MKVIKKRILIITELYPFPGNAYLGTFVVQQLQSLKINFDITVLTVYPKSLRLRKKRPKYLRQESGISVYSLPYFPIWIHGLGLLGIPPSIRLYINKLITRSRLRREAERLHQILKFDLIHGHETYVGDEAAPIGKILNIPTIFTLHSFYHYHKKIFGKYALHLAVNNILQFDQCISVSSIAAQSYTEKATPQVKFTIIPNGVPLLNLTTADQQITHFANGKKVLLSVGSLLHEKRFNVSIEALSKLPATDVVLVIVGSGSEKEKLERLAKKLNCSERVLWLGTVPPKRMPGVYEASHILVHPSVVDSFSMVCLEAMSHGKVVICNTLIGIREFTTSGENIILTEPNNVSQIVDAINHVLRSNDTYTHISQRAMQLTRTMAWDLQAEKIAVVYRRALAVISNS